VVPPPASRRLDNPHGIEPSVHLSIHAEREQRWDRPGQAALGPRRIRDRQRPAPATATPLNHPVETSEISVSALADQVFGRNEQVIAITLAITYHGR
jgi:hypothetical protein